MRLACACWMIFVFTATCAAAEPGRIAFSAAARSHAVPLDEDGKAFRSLDGDLANVRVVGLGESVHESEPFLGYRAALTKDLVRRHRVTALVLETGLPDAFAADDYVQGRTKAIDFSAALPGHGHLEGVRELVEWLRQWNAGEGRSHPVSLLGADLPGRSGSLVPALDRLEQLMPANAEVMAEVDALRPLAKRIAHTWWRGATDNYNKLSAEEKAAFTARVERLVARVQAAGGVPLDRLAWAQRVAFVAQKFEEMLRLGAYHPAMSRNHAMGGNVAWIAGRLPPGERAVFWAHNAHIQRAPLKADALPPGPFVSTGTVIHAALGRGYYAIATSYGGPSLDKAATQPREDSVDEVLSQLAPAPYLLRLEPASATPHAAGWLAEERPMRFQVGNLRVPLGRAFDAVAFFPAAKPAARAGAK
jgi:erythromycin esterase